jgi:hypothetical protein
VGRIAWLSVFWGGDFIRWNLIAGIKAKGEGWLLGYEDALKSEVDGNGPFVANLYAGDDAAAPATPLRLIIVNDMAGKLFSPESDEDGELGANQNAAPLRELDRIENTGKRRSLKIE